MRDDISAMVSLRCLELLGKARLEDEINCWCDNCHAVSELKLEGYSATPVYKKLEFLAPAKRFIPKVVYSCTRCGTVNESAISGLPFIDFENKRGL